MPTNSLDIKKLSEVLLFSSRSNMFKLHLYAKLLCYGHTPYDNDLNILVNLYERGGYSNEAEQRVFFEDCINSKYKKSVQSLRNTLSDYTTIGVLERPKNKKRFLSAKWLPVIQADKLVLDYKITHN